MAKIKVMIADDHAVVREGTRRILEQVKLLESRGFQYEEAEASFEVLVHRA